MNANLEGLPDNVKVKITQCTLAKKMWDKVQLLYIVEAIKDSNEEDKNRSPNEKASIVEEVKREGAYSQIMEGHPNHSINLEKSPCKYSFDKKHLPLTESTFVKSCFSPNLNKSESVEESHQNE